MCCVKIQGAFLFERRDLDDVWISGFPINVMRDNKGCNSHGVHCLCNNVKITRPLSGLSTQMLGSAMTPRLRWATQFNIKKTLLGMRFINLWWPLSCACPTLCARRLRPAHGAAGEA